MWIVCFFSVVADYGHSRTKLKTSYSVPGKLRTAGELDEKLKKIGIGKDFYSFGGVYTDGTLVLDESINYYSKNKQYKEWRVFLHERGIRYDERIFYNEAAALDDMYERLKKYKILRKNSI